jgi:hypothetical protein
LVQVCNNHTALGLFIFLASSILCFCGIKQKRSEAYPTGPLGIFAQVLKQHPHSLSVPILIIYTAYIIGDFPRAITLSNLDFAPVPEFQHIAIYKSPNFRIFSVSSAQRKKNNRTTASPSVYGNYVSDPHPCAEKKLRLAPI